jgi:hypothetical protein
MKKVFILAATAVFAGVMMTGCGSSKQVVDTDRGKKQAKEECQQLALEKTKGWRDFGNGVSPKESFAISLATLDARSRLAAQIQTQVEGLINGFNEQHAADVIDLVGKEGQMQKGYFDELLAGSKVICQNTYTKKDGTYNVYVCVEMSEASSAAIYKKLSDDKKLSIDFSEQQFKQELEKAREDYRSRNQ